MKIRNGFVSNSSSSSFIVLLPDNFSKEDLDFSKANVDDDEITKEDVYKTFEELKNDKVIYEYDRYEEMRVLSQMLEDFIVVEISGGSDDGLMELINNKKVKKILGV